MTGVESVDAPPGTDRRRSGHAALGRSRVRGPIEAPPGFEPGMKDLQSSALPLGHGADGG